MKNQKVKITEKLVSNIVQKRKEFKLSSYELSQKIEKNKTWLSNIENMKQKKVKYDDLKKISDFFQCSIEELADNTSIIYSDEEYNEQLLVENKKLLLEIDNLRKENTQLKEKLIKIGNLVNG